MFDKIKDKIYEEKADLYLQMLLDSFYKDYNEKIKRRESTLKCTGGITLTSKDINYKIMDMLFDKAWDMGAIVKEERYKNIIFVKLAEQGRGVKHTLHM